MIDIHSAKLLSKVAAALTCRKPVIDYPAVELLNYAFQSFFRMFVRSYNIFITGQQMEFLKVRLAPPAWILHTDIPYV